MAEKLPRAQGVQEEAPPKALMKPLGHTAQAEAEVAPTTAEAVPGGQEMQPLLVWPGEGLKLPALQGEQEALPALPELKRPPPGVLQLVLQSVELCAEAERRARESRVLSSSMLGCWK